jgi:hypothetical protein
MAAALEAAHRAGVVHRDFKSSNVMLVGERAVVTDFGLARTTDGCNTDSLATAGTPAYLAPEQVKGEAASAAADVYALGVVMYEMATGALPFEAATPLATAVQRLEREPRAPRSRAPDLDPRWEAAILRCLRREPAERFKSATEAARALDLPAPRRRWRNRAVVAAVLTTVAAGLVAASHFSVPRAQPVTAARPAAATPRATALVPSAPMRVRMVLLARPSSARWTIDGKRLTCNPCVLEGASGSLHDTLARARGYREWRRRLTLDDDTRLEAHLTPLALSESKPAVPSELLLDTANPYH